MQKSRRQLLTSAVIAFGVADCVGIYVAQNRLAEPVPDSVRSDPSVVAVIETGVFRPDQGMPAAGAPVLAEAAPKAAAPVAQDAASAPAQLAAVAAPKPVTLARADAQQRYAPLVPVAIKPSHRGAAQGVFGAVDLSARPALRAAPARPAAERLAAARPAGLQSGARQSKALHPAAGVRASQAIERVDSEFAAAFGNDLADVVLDVQVTRQLDAANASPLLAAEDAVGDVALAHNTAVSSPAEAAANIELPAVVPDSAAGAIVLPEAGKL